MAFQSQSEYSRARAVLLGLRGLGTPEALVLVEPLYEALGSADPDRYSAMLALTREGEAILGGSD
jgi:hypothetical protein